MNFKVMNFLEEKVIPARGCTEPIAVSLAVSLAYHALYGKLPKFLGGSRDHKIPSPEIEKIKELKVKLDRDTFKNSYAIRLPNTGGKRGLKVSIAMGLYSDPNKKLELMPKVSPATKQEVEKLLKERKIKIEVEGKEKKSELDIEVSLKYSTAEGIKRAQVRIQREHTGVTYVGINGKVLYENNELKEEKEENFPKSLIQLIKIAQELTPEEKKEVYKGIQMNEKLVEEGLKNEYGLKVGKTLQKLVKEGWLKNDLVTEVKIKTSAAEDARVGGANLPAMSTAGSGSQGITATIPIVVTAKRNSYDKNKLIAAVMLSHLVTKYVNNYMGYLSALCGCAGKASLGATAGITYYLGGDKRQINQAINIVAAAITGVICDGAKESCALKVSLAAGLATESALMATQGMQVKSNNGIVAKRAEETIKNIGKISRAMINTDEEILKIIQAK